MPVVATPLHSQLPAVAVGVQGRAPRRAARVRDDRRRRAPARALATSSRRCRDRDLIDATITCGHAFGGDFEAVSSTPRSRSPGTSSAPTPRSWRWGPGIVGTGTALGFSGIEVGAGARRGRRARRATRSCACGCPFADERDAPPGRLAPHRSPRLRVGTPQPGHDPGARGRRRARGRIRTATSTRRARGAPRRGHGRHPDVVARLRRPRPAASARWAGRRPRIRCCSRRGRGRGRRGRSRNLGAPDADGEATRRDLMGDAPDRRERLLNLLAALLETRAGAHARRDRHQRLARVPAGPGVGPARRSSGTRRACGRWACRSGRMGDDNESRYRVDPKEYYLPDLELSDDELAALHVAVTAIGLGGGGEGDGRADEARRARGHRRLPGGRAPARRHARAAVRRVAPACRRGLHVPRAAARGSSRGGSRRSSGTGTWWGYDLGADEMRVFRADRIEDDVETTGRGAFTVPGDFRPTRTSRTSRGSTAPDGRPTCGCAIDRRLTRSSFCQASRARGDDRPPSPTAPRWSSCPVVELRGLRQLRARLPRSRRGALASRRRHATTVDRRLDADGGGERVSPRSRPTADLAAGAGDGAVAGDAPRTRRRPRSRRGSASRSTSSNATSA